MTKQNPLQRVGLTTSVIESVLRLAEKGDIDRQHRRADKRKKMLEKLSPILGELEIAGFKYETLDDLRRSGVRYVTAIPILVSWLGKFEDLDVKGMIVRALSVPWAKLATTVLLDEFRISTGLSKANYRWAVGNAISIIADENVLDELLNLALDRTSGSARQMIVLALGKMKPRERIIPVLTDLLSDNNVVGHSISALGKLRATEARPQIAALQNHKNSWIRSEVKKALSRIDQ